MDILQNTISQYLPLVLIGILLAATIILIVRNNVIQRNNQRLVLKLININLEYLKSIAKNNSSVITAQQQGLLFQKKSFDHHRVLISSMIKQINGLQCLITQKDTIDGSDSNKIGGNSILRNPKTNKSFANTVLLKSILSDPKRVRLQEEPARLKFAELSTDISTPESDNFEPKIRRTSNG